MSFIDLKLPELSIYVHRIDFLPHEDEMYRSLKAEAEGTLKEYRAQAATAGVNASKEYRFLLEILLRMRQVCNHSKLCGEGRIKALPDLGNNVMLDLTPENKKLLQEMLQLNVDSQEDCPVCMEPLSNDPVITTCTHTFCYPCIERVIETQAKCPMCRQVGLSFANALEVFNSRSSLEISWQCFNSRLLENLEARSRFADDSQSVFSLANNCRNLTQSTTWSDLLHKLQNMRSTRTRAAVKSKLYFPFYKPAERKIPPPRLWYSVSGHASSTSLECSSRSMDLSLSELMAPCLLWPVMPPYLHLTTIPSARSCSLPWQSAR